MPYANQYAARGVIISVPSGPLSIIDEPLYEGAKNSAPNALENYDGQAGESIIMDFTSKMNRAGFYLATNNIDNIEITVTCLHQGNVIGSEVFVTTVDTQFFGFESADGFDQIIFDAVGNGNGAIVIDDLRFEGGSDVSVTSVDFTATDACGNTALTKATFTIENVSNCIDEEVVYQPAESSDDDKAMVELDFNAYPVPFDHEVNISYNFEFDTDVTIQVFDTKGLLILTETNKNYSKNSRAVSTYDLSKAGDQVFYVMVTTNRGTITKKIVSSNAKR